MSLAIEEALPGYDTLTDVKSEQVRIIFASTTSTLLAILLSSFILAAVQWDTINHTTVIAWFVTINLLSLVRLLLYKQFKTARGRSDRR
ncbi:MAG: hypothetical protein GY896_23460 [Gammaproteobacteria bacterium]|nr:hypothetical protein [Gammaproteobacteria bacterium]